MSETCIWSRADDGSEVYETSCQEGCFMLNSGTPSENGMRFCCYCGKPLEEYLGE